MRGKLALFLILLPSMVLADCFEIDDPNKAAIFQSSQLCGNFATDTSTFSFTVPPGVPIYTSAEINSPAGAPSLHGATPKVSLITGCSNCARTCSVCVSTGLPQGAWGCIANTLNKCQ